MSAIEGHEDIGLFKNYVGKLFFIKYGRNLDYLLDTAGSQDRGGYCVLWSKSRTGRFKCASFLESDCDNHDYKHHC